MQNQWAFHWVVWLLHNRLFALGVFSGVTLGVLLGNVYFSMHDFMQMGLLGLSLLAMSLVAAWLMQSIKTALLMLLFSFGILLMVTGALGWLGMPLEGKDGLASLAFLVVVTMLISNLVHLLTGLHREMARGQFQHDALSEALQLNFQPVVLSNVTTAVSFIVAAWFEPSLREMAWIVGLGALFSLWVSGSWLPWILLNWLIECRVGEPKDRHGLGGVVNFLKLHPRISRFIFGIGMLLGGVALWWILPRLHGQEVWHQLLGVFFGLTLLLAIVWKSVWYALLNMVLGMYSIVIVATIWILWQDETLQAWMLVVPLGLIVDDGIHFFVRYLRAKRGFFQQPEQAIRFTLVSIGRPIWVTSILLIVGVGVLLFSDNILIQKESFMVISSLLVMTWVVLNWVPAIIISKS